MDTIFSIFTFAAALLFFLHLTKVLFMISCKTEKQKKLPPSPPSLPIIGHLHHLKLPLHQSLAQLSARHGPILLLRFGTRPVLVVSSAALAEECFTTNDVAFANRPKLPSLRLITYNYVGIVTANSGPVWREMRRIAYAEALSSHRLAFFADFRSEEARDLARGLFRDATIGNFTRVELRPRLLGMAMNVMMRMMFGKRYYGEVNDAEEARGLKEMVKRFFTFVNTANAGDFLPTPIGWFARRGVEKELARIHSYMDGFLQTHVEERGTKRTAAEEQKERKSTHNTMIDAILSMQKDQPEQYSDAFIKNLFLAGIDTSTNAIEWALSLLLNNPEKLARARKEIDEKLGHNRLFEESDLANLPYLQCIIKETLRLYPVLPLLLPHYALEPCKVGGYDVSSETMLMINAYMIQRDSKIWPEPTRFIPERFLESKAEKGMMLPFGMGRRECPGEGLALKEVSLALGTLIQYFEWRRVSFEEVDLNEGSGITMPKATPLEALCMPRQIMVKVLSQL